MRCCMNPMIWLAPVVTVAMLLTPLSLQAQDVEVPRTRTSPGIESPLLPYVAPEEVGLSSEQLGQLGDEVARWVANGDIVGAELLIAKSGRVVFHEAYGWADREERRPVERGATWSIKSMTKPITATAVLILAEDGVLSLDDPVGRHIPAFVGDERTTIRHLLTHTSGYENEGSGNYEVYYPDALQPWVEDIASRPPTGTFGRYRYSDVNYAALGYIVEAVTGVHVESFIEARILRPLGLSETHASFSPEASWASRVPSRYRWSESGDYERYWSNQDIQPWGFFPAAFGLWSTAMDYAAFATMWLNDGEFRGVRLLSEGMVAEALTSPEGRPYGYGWTLEMPSGSGERSRVFKHGGGDGTVAISFPAADVVAVFLTHSQVGGLRSLALRNRLAGLDGLDDPGERMVWADERDVATVDLAPEERARYAGTFRGRTAWGEELVFRVWEGGDHLHVSLSDPGSLADVQSHLVPFGGHRFAFGRYRDGHLEAIRPEPEVRFAVEGETATAFELHAGGDVDISAGRFAPEQLQAEFERKRNRLSVAEAVDAVLEVEGSEAARTHFRKLLAVQPDSIRFGVRYLDLLGQQLLREGRVEEATALFEANADAYPEAPIAHGSLAEAYRTAGRLNEAQQRFERAVALSEVQAELKWRMYWRLYRARLHSVTRQIQGQ